ncbi:hypothetical protein ACFQXA_06690 [Nocardiopsis composta]
MHRPDRQGERRRKAVLLAVLAPTAAIAAWGPLTAMRADMPAAPAGAALAAAVTAGPVWWGTAGVRPERGLAALFLPAWGACVLGAAAGDGLAGAVRPPLSLPAAGPGGTGHFGWFAYAPLGPEEGGPGRPRSPGPRRRTRRRRRPGGPWPLPQGTADGAIAFGRLAGAAAVFAHRRAADGPARSERAEGE